MLSCICDKRTSCLPVHLFPCWQKIEQRVQRPPCEPQIEIQTPKDRQITRQGDMLKRLG